MKHVRFFLGLGLLLAGSSMAATVTLDEVKGLPVGTLYSGQPTGVFDKGGPELREGEGNEVMLIRTETGFTYIRSLGGQGAAAAQKVPCNEMGKSGGVGNAVVSCALSDGSLVRFEWLDLGNVKYDYWFDRQHQSGQKRHKPAQATAALTQQKAAHTGKVLPAGAYTVSFEKSKRWAPVHYTLEADGGFLERNAGGKVTRDGTWKEVDGDFCHIDGEVHCYKLLSRSSDGKTVELQYIPGSGSASDGYKAMWTRD